MLNWRRRIESLTRSLRSSSHPIYGRLRELLSARGIDIRNDIMVNLVEEGSSTDSGVVVTRDKRVFEFEYCYRDTPHERATFRVWRELTDTYQRHALRRGVDTALAMLDEDASHAAGMVTTTAR